jgi:tRNA-dihydrouridine synthase
VINPRGIRQVVESVERIPVIGNGDVRTVADAARMMDDTGCHGVSVGRGALANPWIFRQLEQWERTGAFEPAGTFDDRLNLMLRQFGYLAEQVGPAYAMPRFRKMAHWYLKGMRVRAALRHRFQLVRTQEEFEAALAEVRREGPACGARDGILTDVHVPVPGGAVERW